jgi:hypothetical protein
MFSATSGQCTGAATVPRVEQIGSVSRQSCGTWATRVAGSAPMARCRPPVGTHARSHFRTHFNDSCRCRPPPPNAIWDGGQSAKLGPMESVREVTARGRGHWYRTFDMELATRTTTWTDSSGANARTLHAYELRCLDPAVGSRYFATDNERKAFIGRSFTDIALRQLDPPERQEDAHPLTHLIGQRLDAVSFIADYAELRWADDYLRIEAHSGIRDATGQITDGTPGYQDRLAALAGCELASVDEFLDRGLVLTFAPETELVIPLGDEGNDGPEAAEYSSTDEWSRGAIWYAGQPPFG